MKRSLEVILGIVMVLSSIILYNLLRDAQWAHSWLKTILVMLPELGTLIAIVELHHSGEANTLREERNTLAKANNEVVEARNKLEEKYGELQREFQTEHNEHLAAIARGMQRPRTQAERNADRLSAHT